MRRPASIFAALTAAALVALVVAALLDERTQTFSLGVARSSAVETRPRQEACQAPIAVPARATFEGVTFAVGTNDRPGPELSVSVIDLGVDGAGPQTVLTRGTLRGGYPDVDRAPTHTVWLEDPVTAGRSIAVCVRNRGTSRAFIYGDADAAERMGTALVDLEPVGMDLALDFERRDSRSLAALLPAMFDRVALFRAQWVGAWTYVLLALLVLLAVPALLVRALRAAERDAA